MTWWQGLLLGALQGLTEFLPVSSSGHLSIAESFLGVAEPQMAAIALHFATLLAVIAYFYRDLQKMKLADWRPVLIATVPALVIGFFFKDYIELIFGQIQLVAMALIVTGSFNLLAANKMMQINKPKKSTKVTDVGWLVIGLFQAFALIPGISRSGSTILGGLRQGLDKESAFRFSFILSIPAILAASAYQLLQIWREPVAGVDLLNLLFGSLAAGILGYLSLSLMSKLLKKAQWWWFAVYPMAMGLVVLLFS